MVEKPNSIKVKDAKSWRDWLLKNHDQSEGVWLIFFHKKSGKPSITYNEAVDQALCFGWIDSRPNKRDHESSYRYFSPRNPKSNWSRINKAKIKRLSEEGLLHEAGKELVEIAKENGAWNALDDVENLVVPSDLLHEFHKYSKAFKYWDAFPRSVKRSILEWITNAKRPETRIKRIRETAKLAQENIRANQYKG